MGLALWIGYPKIAWQIVWTAGVGGACVGGRSRCHRRGATICRGPRMPSPETADVTASISAFLQRPVRPLPEFVAELRCRLDPVLTRAQPAGPAPMIPRPQRAVEH